MRKSTLLVTVIALGVSAAAQPPAKDSIPEDSLRKAPVLLKTVTVAGRKSLVKQVTGKTIINVEASITSAGATLMEVLERSPGVTVDKNGSLSLKGRSNVLVMIDGKPTYVGGAELAALLNGMSAAQVEQIELISNPPAGFDAAGNAGIINIRTKKPKQAGFNGSINASYTQGRYARTNNSLLFQYRNGRINSFLNYSFNDSRNFTDLYAYRQYFAADGRSVIARLDQPSRFNTDFGYHNLRAGMDYTLSKKTNLGITLAGNQQHYNGDGYSAATWLNESGIKDSVIFSTSTSPSNRRNGAINLNLRQVFNSREELTADLDWLGYRIRNDQQFNNQREGAGGYSEAIRGEAPSTITILSAKADYARQLAGSGKWEAGWKSSRVNTDNDAAYFIRTTGNWQPDLGRTNHFLYKEYIHAVYSNLSKQWEKFSLQGGLRYEYTNYDARQLGNASRKDSSFSRHYQGLFPSVTLEYKADSLHRFSLSGGRRIDRPPFQKLNPFVFVINKYTNQGGNPYFLPQYTWNIETGYQYKEWLSAQLRYSNTSQSFSQIFLTDSNGIITYTEGNVGRRQNYGLSVSVNADPLPWWNCSLQLDLLHKKVAGYLWKAFDASINQGTMNINNQFRFKKGWAAELTGYYITRSQEDLQEVVEPTGQVGLGISKQVLNNKGSIRLSARDIFYTQAMAGLSLFQYSDEYFKIKRDTRNLTISFSWRFGKAVKSAARKTGGAQPEIERVGGDR
ncbi:MAG: TonB-dependent receptor [Candidatus Pseudobacter hemicellulosilyticus]|uniref:TonB-dependent receptor n=1 Tax=Candidatus Pseudobacter hemicellulosilyticus TaxID=3121375 RepID=A0AAJ5WWR1_9BACT|nr:MAG: TonB-dependent receptor [Pseudobacter sp.]